MSPTSSCLLETENHLKFGNQSKVVEYTLVKTSVIKTTPISHVQWFLANRIVFSLSLNTLPFFLECDKNMICWCYKDSDGQ